MSRRVDALFQVALSLMQAARRVLAVLLAAAVLPVLAQGARPVADEQGPRWQDLPASQRSVLKPLERDWPAIDATRKQKWLDIAKRYPGLPPAEQARISARMTQWSTLSPSERGQARLNYQEARQLSPQERQARWEAYQALPPEQRRQLAARAAPPAASSARATDPARRPAAPRDGSRESIQTKSNIVPNPAYAAPPKAVAPTVVQAQSGATTSLMSKRPLPPSHQQPGLPKIAASPGFVDKATLLPQRGPQGAAARSPAPGASAPTRGAR